MTSQNPRPNNRTRKKYPYTTIWESLMLSDQIEKLLNNIHPDEALRILARVEGDIEDDRLENPPQPYPLYWPKPISKAAMKRVEKARAYLRSL